MFDDDYGAEVAAMMETERQRQLMSNVVIKEVEENSEDSAP